MRPSLPIVTFDEAMRRFIEDAPSNFARSRGANRSPDEEVVTEFDCSFAVDGALDACIALLDYDVPHARIIVYDGEDDAAAQRVFEAYGRRLQQFADDGCQPNESQYSDEACRWSWIWFTSREGVMLESCRAQSTDPQRKSNRVWVDVAGYEIECIRGRPEDSPFHIIFAGTSLHADYRGPSDPTAT